MNNPRTPRSAAPATAPRASAWPDEIPSPRPRRSDPRGGSSLSGIHTAFPWREAPSLLRNAAASLEQSHQARDAAQALVLVDGEDVSVFIGEQVTLQMLDRAVALLQASIRHRRAAQ